MFIFSEEEKLWQALLVNPAFVGNVSFYSMFFFPLLTERISCNFNEFKEKKTEYLYVADPIFDLHLNHRHI